MNSFRKNSENLITDAFPNQNHADWNQLFCHWIPTGGLVGIANGCWERQINHFVLSRYIHDLESTVVPFIQPTTPNTQAILWMDLIFNYQLNHHTLGACLNEHNKETIPHRGRRKGDSCPPPQKTTLRMKIRRS